MTNKSNSGKLLFCKTFRSGFPFFLAILGPINKSANCMLRCLIGSWRGFPRRSAGKLMALCVAVVVNLLALWAVCFLVALNSGPQIVFMR